eukprot:TRINITY_DN16683_c0_g1_i2.p1 TRINITY_DN16683_c0_g1~~TRINITY_DN16683_c0_g1_i2.p1  ORF type:complete len:320 (+),score=36.91 TRINITY_DN16683_c0_g1_i2:87-1046(+)
MSSKAATVSTDASSGDDQYTVQSDISVGNEWMEPQETMIVLDWDDTLFPTADLFDRWGCPSRPNPDSVDVWSAEQQAKIDLWAAALDEFLKCACTLSDYVVILTNAQEGWVERCVQRFAPCVADLISSPRITVAYALKGHLGVDAIGSTVKHSCAPSPWSHRQMLTNSKFRALKNEAKKCYSRYRGQTMKNIVSIGDMDYERDAIKELGFRCKNDKDLRIKSVLVPSQPTVSEVTLRLQYLKLISPAFVCHDGDIDLDLRNVDNSFEAIADALDMDDLSDADFPEHAFHRQETPEDYLVNAGIFRVARVIYTTLNERLL